MDTAKDNQNRKLLEKQIGNEEKSDLCSISRDFQLQPSSPASRPAGMDTDVGKDRKYATLCLRGK